MSETCYKGEILWHCVLLVLLRWGIFLSWKRIGRVMYMLIILENLGTKLF